MEAKREFFTWRNEEHKKEDEVGPSMAINIETDEDELDSGDEPFLELWNHVNDDDDDE